MSDIDEETLALLADFVETLGCAPDGPDEGPWEEEDPRKALVFTVTREDIRKLLLFRPRIAPRLEGLGMSFEEAVALALRAGRIEYFQALNAIAAERCRQAAEDKATSAELPAGKITETWDGVYHDYQDRFDDAAIARTRLRYDGLARGVAELAGSLREVFRKGAKRRARPKRRRGRRRRRAGRRALSAGARAVPPGGGTEAGAPGWPLDPGTGRAYRAGGRRCGRWPSTRF